MSDSLIECYQQAEGMVTLNKDIFGRILAELCMRIV